LLDFSKGKEMAKRELQSQTLQQSRQVIASFVGIAQILNMVNQAIEASSFQRDRIMIGQEPLLNTLPKVDFD
jgi:hypothetical protein